MLLSGWLYLTQQTLGCLCALTAAGRALGLRRLRPWRVALAAFCGAGAAWVGTSGPLWLTAASLPVAAALAFPRLPRSLRLHVLVLLGALSLLQAGCARLLDTAGVPAPVIPPLCGGMTLLLPPLLTLRSSAVCSTVEVTTSACCLRLTALVDTGNLLRDPVTRLPVIVISRRTAARLTDLPSHGMLRPGMRLIRVRTAAGRAMMTVLRPQSVRILLGNRWQSVQAVIGLSPEGYDGFSALLPACLIRGEAEHVPSTQSQGG